jgi:glutamate-1-semialdehyde 2,1-aminomutase
LNFKKRLNKLIPGGSHTYSRGFDQFPNNVPQILKRGKDSYVWDNNNNKYLDYGMGLRSVTIGYASKPINKEVIKNLNKGNNLTLPSTLELEAAEELVSLIDSAEMVKFAKNGSNVTTAAVKIARAYTGKEIVLIPKEQPFFSFDDWFIGKTEMNKGVPKKYKTLTDFFNFNDISSLEKLFVKYKNNVAAVMLEPSTIITPCHKSCKIKISSKIKCYHCNYNSENFLKKVENICKKNNAVFILDEMITGFRWDLKGAQNYYDVNPDISTFGKGMANGFSIAALVGKKKILDFASIDKPNMERTFLLSSTHGAEMTGLAAFLAVVKFYKDHDVCNYLWDYGNKLKNSFNELIYENKLEDNFKIIGADVLFNINTYIDAEFSYELKTLFLQEMLKNNILMPWISPSYSHKQKELLATCKAINHSLKICKIALKKDIRKYIKGNIIKPVFRRFN